MKIQFYKRDQNGRFKGTWIQKTIHRTIQATKLVIFATVVLSLTGWAILSGIHLSPHITQASAPGVIDVSERLFKDRVEVLKNNIIDTLAQCENKGYTADGIQMILDTNHKASIGPLMFQVDTVIHYHKLRTNEKLTKKDAIILALDESRAKDLAKYVLFETPNMAGKDWVNCNKKYGLDEQIKIIKKIANL